MKIVNTETKRTQLPKEKPRYSYHTIHHKGGTQTYESRCHSFVEKIEGKRFVDGEFISNWVQYK